MFTSRMLAPLRTWSTATAGGRRVVARLDQLREARRARDVGALADHLEVGVGPQRQGLEAGEARVAPSRREGPHAARTAAVADAMASMCAGVVPQHPPTMLRKPGRGELGEVGGHHRRRLVVAAERIRQAGVRVAAHVAVGDRRQLRQVRPHVARAERAVDADRERRRVRHRDPERVDGLPRQRPAAAVGDRQRDHQRARPSRSPRAVPRGPRGRPSRSARRCRSRTGRRSTPPSIRPRSCVLNASRIWSNVTLRAAASLTSRRDRQRAVRRPDRARDEARTVGRPRGPLGRHAARQARRLEIQLVDDVLRARSRPARSRCC